MDDKYQEILLYLFCGGIAFGGNIIIFLLLTFISGMPELVANIVAWSASVLFQFFSNKYLVFKKGTLGVIDFIRQMVEFFLSCLITLAIEELIILIFISWLKWRPMLVKVCASIFVIVINYLIRKFFLFQDKKEKEV